ncbi:hypothetical protein QTP88_016345 [Uroleucon formosanum]
MICTNQRVEKNSAPKSSLHNIIVYDEIRDANDSIVFQEQFSETTAMDVDVAGDDDYVLTPLQADAEDPEPDVADEDGRDDAADETGTAADDYVQSLVTIESNWENEIRNSNHLFVCKVLPFLAVKFICRRYILRRKYMKKIRMIKGAPESIKSLLNSIWDDVNTFVFAIPKETVCLCQSSIPTIPIGVVYFL